MSNFATGVTVLTTRTADGVMHGMTANAVTSVSLDPPLVLVCVDRGARTHRYIEESRAFALNILSEDQRHLSERFARRDAEGPSLWVGLSLRPGATGSPVILDTIAYVDCRLFAAYPGGDHTIFVGEVVDLGVLSDKPPLLFFRSGYTGVAT
jgi:flavin reductase (DIM6/NTAB) family NADH-FMN oxidoreductase RutF